MKRLEVETTYTTSMHTTNFISVIGQDVARKLLYVIFINIEIKESNIHILGVMMVSVT